MKLLYCTFDDPKFTGGPNSWFRTLLPKLARTGHDVTVLVFRNREEKDCPLITDLRGAGMTCYSELWNLSTERKIKWILAKADYIKPDIFLPSMLVSAYFAAGWIKAAGIPTVGILHSDDEFYHGIARVFLNGNSRFRLTALNCVSKVLFDRYHQTNHSTEITHIPYSVAIPEKLPSLPFSPFKLVWLGRLVTEQKRVLDVAEALCKAAIKFPNLVAVFYGEGPEKETLIRYLGDNGNGRVTYGGLIRHQEIYAKLAQNHALVLLSDYEGLPISVLEGMACGLVPIVLDIKSGIPELIQHGENGLVVKDRGEDFIAKVGELQDSPEKWQNLRTKAHQAIRERYSVEQEIKSWNSLFTKIQNNKPKRKIKIPRFLFLPRPDPALKGEDVRERTTARKIAGRIKRNLISSFKRFSGESK